MHLLRNIGYLSPRLSVWFPQTQMPDRAALAILGYIEIFWQLFVSKYTVCKIFFASVPSNPTA
jgi:hypothetical protein